MANTFPHPSRNRIVVCGLDGVIALIEHRLHHLYNDEGRKDWDRFAAACVDDLPNLPLIDRLNQARAEGVPVVLISGRSSSVRTATEAWLRQWQIGYDALWLRPAGDFSPAAKFKTAVLAQHYPRARVHRWYESVRQLGVAQWCDRQQIPCTLVGANQGNGESRELFEVKVVTHGCRHATLYPFYGDDDFTWEERRQQLAAVPCPVCQAEELDEERRRKATEARLAASERGLPPLEGSDRQVAWAEGIRVTAFAAIDKVLHWVERSSGQAETEDPDHWQTVVQGIDRAVTYLEQQIEAKWWIDHRHGIMNNLDAGRALLAAVAEDQGYF